MHPDVIIYESGKLEVIEMYNVTKAGLDSHDKMHNNIIWHKKSHKYPSVQKDKGYERIPNRVPIYFT